MVDRHNILYIDDRERYVTELFESDKVDFRIERLDVGDYIIMDNKRENLKAVFERKTLNDQSSSITDGRHENVHKLVELRAKLNCDLYYIIEKCNYTGSLPLETVYTSIYNLMVRHRIQILFSENMNETVALLTKLMDVYTKVSPPKDIISSESNINLDDVSKLICENKTILAMWCAISGVSKHTALLLRQFKFIDYLKRDTEFANKINTLTYYNGKQLPSHIRLKLTSPLQYDIINSLSECRGITKTVAQELSNNVDWNVVTEEKLTSMKINNKKLGKYGSNLYKLINFIWVE